MKARLGLAVASAIRPNILLIDEVLGVGDPNFREKSKKKILSLVKGASTVVIVSHSFGLMTDICDRVVLLDHGKIGLLTIRKPLSRRIMTWGGIMPSSRKAMTVRERQLSDETQRIRSTYSFQLGLLLTETFARKPWRIPLFPILFVALNLRFLRQRKQSTATTDSEHQPSIDQNCILLFPTSRRELHRWRDADSSPKSGRKEIKAKSL